MRKVEVLPYQPQWVALFEDEAANLRQIFGALLLEIHHIGSTSVPGLPAKPIIDLMPVVRDIQRVDEYNSSMLALGYKQRGENGIPGRRYFEKGGDKRTHHVHIYQVGNPQLIRHLAFRDYLRQHPETATAYGALKEGLAKQYPHDIDSYIKGKEPLVVEIEQQAMNWFIPRGNRGELRCNRADGYSPEMS